MLVGGWVGGCDEASFQRLDLVLAKAAENEIRVIMPLSNFEAELGARPSLAPLSLPLSLCVCVYVCE